MKIGFISRTVYPLHGFGGAEKHVFHITRGLAERGHEVHLFCLEAREADEEDYEELEHENLTLHEVEYRDLGLGRANFIQFNYLMRKNWDLLDEMDVVHSSSLFPATYYSIFRDNNVVVTTHGLEEFMHNHLSIPLWPLNQVDRYASRKHIDRFIALSEGNAEDQKKYIGIGEEKIRKIPNGVDSDFFKPSDTSELEEKYGLKGNVLVAVSRLVKYKGHGLLVDVVNEMDDTSLVIAGDGPYREELEDKAGEDVYVVGRVDEEMLPVYYSLGDVFSLPTFGEGLPLSILESLSCGTPVVSTEVGSIPDVINEDIGTLVEPEDREELRKGIEDVLGRKSQEMSERCREYVKDNYSWDSVVEQTEDVYRNLNS